MNTGAIFSPDRKYRYKLWRIWDPTKRVLAFCLLNPSTADETANDPTVERCQRRAEMMGYGGLIVINVFAFRATDPCELYHAEDPIGPENNKYIFETAEEAGMVICGWGNHGNLMGRGKQILGDLQLAGKDPHVLKLNQDGTPAHPLYIGYKVKPERMYNASMKLLGRGLKF